MTDPDAIQRDIDATRDRVGETLNELRDRVSPRRIWGRAVERGRTMASNTGERLKRQPLPFVFAATGVASVLLLGAMRGRGREPLRERLLEGRDLEAPRERLHEARERLGDRDRGGVVRVAHEEPMLLGILGLALGALFGAQLPRTEIEDRYFGHTRDRTLQRAQRVASEGYARARAMAHEARTAWEERGSRLH